MKTRINDHNYMQVRGTEGRLNIIMDVSDLVGGCEKQELFDLDARNFFAINSLSPDQARKLAEHLLRHADHAEGKDGAA